MLLWGQIVENDILKQINKTIFNSTWRNLKTIEMK